jgi:hypothetical protein
MNFSLKEALKESWRFLFENPVIFLIILGNFVLFFMFAPLIGLIAAWFLSTTYLIGVHGDIENPLEGLKKYAKWGFLLAIVFYLYYIGSALISYYLFEFLIFKLKASLGAILIGALIWAFVLAILFHVVYLPLIASTDWQNFKENLKRLKKLFTTKAGLYSLALLWFFMVITIYAGLLQLFHLTVGLYSVIATFLFTFYTFIGVKAFRESSQ